MTDSFRGNIENLTLNNKNYRKVVSTTSNMQVVVMSLKEGEEIGMEVHRKTSQFIRVESGKASAVVGNSSYRLHDGDFIVVPPNVKHNVKNTGKDPLKLYTIYTPPEHSKGLIQKNKD